MTKKKGAGGKNGAKGEGTTQDAAKGKGTEDEEDNDGTHRCGNCDFTREPLR